ncbi:MAG: acetate--CoA ligase family protein [Deltaproteobacteria bacterium]|nr:acetate--CoA ligase family protein [Deltaproteobacteria bacterium]
MEKIFNPRSILVIGVSEQPQNLARNIVANLIDFGWPGELYLLGRETGVCHGYPIFTEITRLPEAIDLAVILTPAATVPELMRSCIKRKILRMVIESGGFSEFSEAGRRLEEEIKALAQAHQVKFVGPNGISIINRHNGLCLPFMRLSPTEIKSGGLSVISQSGGLALTYIGLGCRENLGVAKVISMGNKSSLDEVDYLRFLAQDQDTRVIGLYLESLEKGREFMAALKTCGKPVILHKSNTSPQSQVIAQSHTAALAVDDDVVDAACLNAGVFRVKTFQQFINCAKALALPPMLGNNLMIISRSGGHAVVAADAAASKGFYLPGLAPEFVDRIASQFRASVIKLTNPLDLGDIFNIDYYITILEMSLKRDDINGVVLNHVFQAESEFAATLRLAEQVEVLAERYHKPVALVLFSGVSAVNEIMERLTLPVFSEPDSAMEALAVSRRRSAFLAAQAEPRTPLPARRQLGRQPLFENWLEVASKHDDHTLLADQALTLLLDYGVPVAPFAMTRHPQEFMEAAEELGFPLVLKAVVSGLSHKSDVGGVLAGIKDRQTLEDAGGLLFTRFSRDPGFCGVLLQKEVDTSLELIVGARRDSSFGDIFLIGMGGVYAEILEDVVLAPAPLHCEMVAAMLERLRGAAILRGARGRIGIDRTQLYRILAGLQALLDDYPLLKEVEINPLVFASGSPQAVDGRIVVF